MRAKTIPLIILLLTILTSCNATVSDETSFSIDSLENLPQSDSIIESVQVENLKEPFYEKSIVYRIVYQSDDCEVVGYISAPLDYLYKEYPVLVYNRGGNRELGKLNPETVANFAVNGYVVLATQYRGVDGGTGTEEFGGAELNDVYKLIDISEEFTFSKKGGVYMAGDSRGGMTTYIACRYDDRIKAAAIFAGISDSAASYHEREYEMKQVFHSLVGGSPEEFPEEYEKRSAVKWACEIDVPLLIVHGGDKDWRVLTSHSEKMAERLEECGKEYKLIIYEDADHSLIETDCMNDMNEWFSKYPLGN